MPGSRRTDAEYHVVIFDGFEIAPLVHALGLHGAASESALTSGFGQATQRHLGIGQHDAQHAAQVAVVEGVSGALQVVVVGKNLLGPGNVAGRPFQVDGIRSQVDIDVQAVFQQAYILVARAEKSLDVGTDFNALLHSVFGASSRALDAELPVRGA